MTSIDLQLLDLINQQWTNAWLDRLMPLVSATNAWTPLLIGVILWLWFGTQGRCWRVMAGIVCCIAVTEYVISYPLKHLAGKLRPNEAVTWVEKRDLAKHPVRILAVFDKPVIKSASLAPLGTRGKSFPSSHVLNTTAVVTFLWLAWGGWTWLLFVIPPLVSWSRVYCGSHWPSDIPHSLVLGVLAAWLVYRWLRPWLRRRSAVTQQHELADGISMLGHERI